MRDVAFDVLLPHVQSVPPGQHQLWVVDENATEHLQMVQANPARTLVSNRWDVVQQAVKLGHTAQFSDFDFSAMPEGSVDVLVYRISKEKAVAHHVINAAARLLKPGGSLYLAGLKTEGLKTYADKAKKLFGNGDIEKHGTAYLATCQREDVVHLDARLDDQHYHELRFFEMDFSDVDDVADDADMSGMGFFSKPGLFGWNKIDQGTALLLDTLPEIYEQMQPAPQSLLDLGCGYGLILLMTRDYPFTRRVATDNNAAAILAVQKNVECWQMDVAISADDCAANLKETFDLILCNPPFHQGFSMEDALTEKFLRNTQRLLARNGQALFVVNAFIALEKKAADYFGEVSVVASNPSFKVIALSKPLR